MSEREPTPAAEAGEWSEGSTLPGWAPELLRVVSRRAFLILVAAALATMLVMGIGARLRDFFSIIFMALFLSFALEPGVDWLASRGWRRGWATGLIFLVAALLAVALIALLVPAIASGFRQLVDNAPELIDKVVRFARRLGIDLSATRLEAEIQKNAARIASQAAGFADNVFGIGASILGGLFRWATIALFTFYFVAEGPRVRRAILSFLPPQRQSEVLFVWDQAIEKTGGYFYSRLLLAAINGTGMYLVLRAFHVPFAAPLALFEGVVAEFIPMVGTYIAGAPPVLIALLTSPVAGIAALAYIVIYQQIENYFLSPRLTAKTMSLHPALAFAAVLIGGALGGILVAFLALPVAAVIQAGVSTYAKRYEVVQSPLTADASRTPKGTAGEPEADVTEGTDLTED